MQTSLRRKLIGDRAFYRMVMAVAIPIMVQNGITQFVGLLDNIMVGRVGTEHMTGVSIANTLMFVFNLTIFGAVSGAGIFGAQFFGSGNHEGVRYAFRFKVLVSLTICLLGAGVFLTLDEKLIMLYLSGEGTPQQIADSLAYAKEYLHIMLLSFVPFAISQCYCSTLRESGQTVVPMVAGICSVLVNLGLNTVLIFGYLGFAPMKSAGAAVATVIARVVEMLIVVIWTHTHSKEQPFVRGAWRSARIPLGLLGRISGKTLPLMLNEMLWAAGMALLNQCYSLRGYDVVSACNISSTISNVFNVAFLAMGNAIGIIVGQLLGANRLEEARDTDRKLVFFAVIICFGIGGAMALVAPLFPQIYNTTPQIRSLAASFILTTALCMPINSLANACYFTLRSGGKTFVTFLFDSFYVCLITVPLAFVLSRFTGVPIVPLFAICQVIDIGKCVVGLVMLKKGVWINNIVKEGAK